MTIEEIKAEILSTHPAWKATGDSLDDDTYASIKEDYIRELISDYCEAQGYLVEGFPTEKRELGKTNAYYDEDYFTWERYEDYINALCLDKDDVLELRFFYYNTFWPDQVTSKEELLAEITHNFKIKLYDTNF
jgi:hypothetical protein